MMLYFNIFIVAILVGAILSLCLSSRKPVS
jgi:hypothetical protein